MTHSASIDVQAEVTIQRPREEVAAFMFDPSRDAIWTSGVIEARPHQDGLLETGAKVDRISKFLGRRMTYLVECTDHAPARFVEMRTKAPFEIWVRYELEDAEDGATLARIRTRGDGTGFFRVAAPLMRRAVRKAIGHDLEMLKTYLDAGGDRDPATG